MSIIDKLGLGDAYIKDPEVEQQPGGIKNALNKLGDLGAAPVRQPGKKSLIRKAVEGLNNNSLGYVPTSERGPGVVSRIVAKAKELGAAPEPVARTGGAVRGAIGKYATDRINQNVVNAGGGFVDDILSGIFTAPEPKEKVDNGPGLLRRGLTTGAGIAANMAGRVISGGSNLMGAVINAGVNAAVNGVRDAADRNRQQNSQNTNMRSDVRMVRPDAPRLASTVSERRQLPGGNEPIIIDSKFTD